MLDSSELFTFSKWATHMMGRIMATVDLENPAEPRGHKKIVALVDTGASRLTLPLDWKGQLGSFEMEKTIEL